MMESYIPLVLSAVIGVTIVIVVLIIICYLYHRKRDKLRSTVHPSKQTDGVENQNKLQRYKSPKYTDDKHSLPTSSSESVRSDYETYQEIIPEEGKIKLLLGTNKIIQTDNEKGTETSPTLDTRELFTSSTIGIQTDFESQIGHVQTDEIKRPSSASKSIQTDNIDWDSSILRPKSAMTMYSSRVSIPERVETLYEQMGEYDIEMGDMFLIKSEREKLLRMISPPERVVQLYDEESMVSYYKELELMYGSLLLEHEKYIMRKGQARQQMENTWKAMTVNSSTNEEQSARENSFKIPFLSEISETLGPVARKRSLSPIKNKKRHKHRKRSSLDSITDANAELQQSVTDDKVKADEAIHKKHENILNKQNRETEEVTRDQSQFNYSDGNDVPKEEFVRINTNIDNIKEKELEDADDEYDDEVFYEEDIFPEEPENQNYEVTIRGSPEIIETAMEVVDNDDISPRSSPEMIRHDAMSRASHLIEGFVHLKEIEVADV